VKKFNADADPAGGTDEYQIQRAYALIRVLKDDVVRISNDEQNAIVYVFSFHERAADLNGILMFFFHVVRTFTRLLHA